jgi:hypothetical protein
MSQVESGQALATTPAEPGTELSTLLQGLSTPQQLALTALVEGKSYVDAATHAGVSRTTLWGWLKTQPKFAEAYEAWQEELREFVRGRLLAATDNAATVLTQAISGGDARLAVRLLHDLGVLSSGPTRKRREQSPPLPAAVPSPAPPPPPAHPDADIPPVPGMMALLAKRRAGLA